MELVLHRQCRPRVDIDRLPWLDSVIASGVPAEYGKMIQMLAETIASGRGSRPNGDVEKVYRSAA